MKLVWHDLTEQDFNGLSLKLNADTTVIGNNGKIKPCIGCYGCWIKTPGICVIKDGYSTIGQLLSKTDELIIISKCVYGSYSPFICNVWDRSISYLLPFFTRINGETHHKKRYKNRITITVFFYGDDITSAEKETAEQLVKANSVNYMPDTIKTYFYNKYEALKEVL
ncbi:MAG: flavodoxin family protein [Treponema sp.]|jgi:multimeric flavodoxin WrbA|nr:flavodoxin family protein [Treponema sp.]